MVRDDSYGKKLVLALIKVTRVPSVVVVVVVVVVVINF
jgi:hypothetical protein